MDKKYPLIGVVLVIVVVAAVITHSFLPPLLKENLGLYQTHEYSQMYLEDEPYTDLVVEYDYVAGHRPNQTAMDVLEKRIGEYTDKEEIVSKRDDMISWQSPSYDRNDISELKDAYMDSERHDDTIPIHVIYLNGVWEETPNVLGLSKRPYNIIVFQEVIEAFANETNLETPDIEASVLVHEFGHLLSLVGNGYESDHQTEDSYHCNEEAGDCVMAETVEFKNHTDQGPPPTHFCELCEEDLEYIREMDGYFDLVDFITYGVIGVEIVIGLGVSIGIIFWVDGKEPPRRKKPPSPSTLSDQGRDHLFEEDRGENWGDNRGEMR